MANDKDTTKPAVDSGSDTGYKRPAYFPIIGIGPGGSINPDTHLKGTFLNWLDKVSSVFFHSLSPR
jgi:hypothetical protein